MADLLLHEAEPRAARRVPLVLDAAARRQELLRGGHARLPVGAGVAEADRCCCWSEVEEFETSEPQIHRDHKVAKFKVVETMRKVKQYYW